MQSQAKNLSTLKFSRESPKVRLLFFNRAKKILNIWIQNMFRNICRIWILFLRQKPSVARAGSCVPERLHRSSKLWPTVISSAWDDHLSGGHPWRCDHLRRFPPGPPWHSVFYLELKDITGMTIKAEQGHPKAIPFQKSLWDICCDSLTWWCSKVWLLSIPTDSPSCWQRALSLPSSKGNGSLGIEQAKNSPKACHLSQDNSSMRTLQLIFHSNCIVWLYDSMTEESVLVTYIKTW